MNLGTTLKKLWDVYPKRSPNKKIFKKTFLFYLLLTFDGYRMKNRKVIFMLKKTYSFAKILTSGAPRGASKHIAPPLFYLYNSITYRKFDTNRTLFGRICFAQNGKRDGRIRTTKNIVRGNTLIKRWTQGVLTRFNPVSFILLKTFFKKQCRHGTYLFQKMCAVRISTMGAQSLCGGFIGQDQLLILPTGFRL